MSEYSFPNRGPQSPAILERIGRRLPIVEAVLAEVLLMLTREQHGHFPVFATDYDVLHPYLFPSFMGARPRIPHSLANLLIRGGNDDLALPPGASDELISFCLLIGRLQAYVHGRQTSDIFSQNDESLLRHYYRRFICPDDQDVSTGDIWLNHALAILSKMTEDSTISIEALPKLLCQIKPLDAFARGWAEVYEGLRRADTIKEIAAIIAARRVTIRPRTTERDKWATSANINDARNVTAVLATRVLDPKGLLERDGRKACVYLCTTTPAVLELKLGDKCADVLPENAFVNLKKVRSGVSFPLCTIIAALLYRNVRRTKPNLNDCFKELNEVLKTTACIVPSLLEIENLLVDAQNNTANANTIIQEIQSLSSASVTTWIYAAQALMKLVSTHHISAEQIAKALEIPYDAMETSEDNSFDLRTDIIASVESLSRPANVRESHSAAHDLFNVSIVEAPSNSSSRSVGNKTFLIKSVLAEAGLGVFKRHGSSRRSFEWPSLGNSASTLRAINRILDIPDIGKGELRLHFRETTGLWRMHQMRSRGNSEFVKVVGQIPGVSDVTAADLVLETEFDQLGDVRLMAHKAEFLMDLWSIEIPTFYSSFASLGFQCRLEWCGSDFPHEILHAAMVDTHVWKWSPKSLDNIIACLSSTEANQS